MVGKLRWVWVVGLLLLVWGGPMLAPAAHGTPDEVVNPKDGSVLVRIPAGPFRMGSSQREVDAVYQDASQHFNGVKKAWFADEVPDHVVNMSEYYIGKYLVTNGQFARFVQQTGYQTEAEKEGWGYAWTGQKFDKVSGASWRSPEGPGSTAGPALPVVQVSWNDAIAYCNWAGVALPTEPGWEKAARGTDFRRYPWGNTWDANLCRCSRDKPGDAGGPAPVGSYPGGASPYGCLDMAGNVYEWTDSWYEAYPGNTSPSADYGQKYRVVRGGSWNPVDPAGFRAS